MGAEQKVAIVTGAASGAGPALLCAYLGRNYRVVAIGDGIGPRCDSVLHIASQLDDEDAAAHIVRQVLQRFGRIDTLVNQMPAIRCTAEGADLCRQRLLEPLGAFLPLTQRVVLVMQQKSHGHVLNICAPGSASAYDHARQGCVEAATVALAAEVAPHRIRVNAITPACDKPAAVADIVHAALYLDAAPFTTGLCLRLDVTGPQ